MGRHVLFVQGAGPGARAEDAELAASLGAALGPAFEIRYPELPDEAAPEAAVWQARLGEELAALGAGALLVGHSAGGANLLMVLATRRPEPEPAGVFLIAVPFCGPGGWDCGDLVLPPDLGTRIPNRVPLFLYHGRADAVVPFAHVDLYAQALPQAVVRRLAGRDHQLNGDLSEVASDIRRLR
jgi:predicted alpha/beta hydrolase family esterase